MDFALTGAVSEVMMWRCGIAEEENLSKNDKLLPEVIDLYLRNCH
jgi:hypothetical protein